MTIDNTSKTWKKLSKIKPSGTLNQKAIVMFPRIQGAREGVDAKDINLAIAKLVQKKLKGMGYQGIMTREDDRYLAVE